MPSNENSEKQPARETDGERRSGPESVAEMVRQVCYDHLEDAAARRLTRALSQVIPAKIWTSEDRNRIQAAQESAERYINRHISE